MSVSRTLRGAALPVAPLLVSGAACACVSEFILGKLEGARSTIARDTKADENASGKTRRLLERFFVAATCLGCAAADGGNKVSGSLAAAKRCIAVTSR